MTIPAIGAISAALPSLASLPSANVAPSGLALPSVGDLGGSTGPGADFATVLGRGIQAVESAQTKADGLAIKAATGDLTDIHDYTIAATQASLLTELATTLRSKGVEAINTIMGLQA